MREPISQLSAFKRLGEPEEVADRVVFLATNRARWITGASLDATGSSLLGSARCVPFTSSLSSRRTPPLLISPS